MGNDFVMVPRTELARLQENMDPHRGAVAWGIVCDLLEKQHQGEPVTPIVIEVKDSCVYLLSGPLDPGQYKLYTHADPGDVERLRGIIRMHEKTVREQADHLAYMRAQLAEQDALLREASAAIKQGDVDFDAVYSSCRNWDELVKDGVANEVALKIDAALSAGAEPSAPIWEGRISNCEVWVNKCSNCGETHRLLECAQAERIEVALSASAEPSDSADLGSCQRRPLWATDGRINTGDASVERDEISDKQRLDSIEELGFSISATKFVGGFCGPNGRQWLVFKYGCGFEVYGETLREALDAARAALERKS